MDDYKLLIDLHKQGHRQGPGGDAETELALNLSIIDRDATLKITDIGCGTGASTLLLAQLLKKHGYSPIAYFVLPEHCWLEEYYRPMQASFDNFLNRNGNSEDARAIVAAEGHEIDLYEKNKAHVSYGVYIARKMG